MRGTHTYAIVRISREAFEEIKEKLTEADYGHAFHPDPDSDSEVVIDMHGLAVGIEE